MSKKLTLIVLIGLAIAVRPSCTTAADGEDRVTFESDLLLLDVNSSDGFSRNNIFDKEASPRFRLGYETAQGAGIRFQYWEFDHMEANGHNGALSFVDTYNIDLEIFRRFDFSDVFNVETSGGIRYNEYDDQNVADNGQATAFSGYGGFLGLKATQTLAFDIDAYARGKWVILAGDANDNGTIDNDVTRKQQEIAIGTQRVFHVGRTDVTVRTGYEWQDWDGYQDDSDGSIGFDGYVLGLDITY